MPQNHWARVRIPMAENNFLCCFEGENIVFVCKKHSIMVEKIFEKQYYYKKSPNICPISFTLSLSGNQKILTKIQIFQKYKIIQKNTKFVIKSINLQKYTKIFKNPPINTKSFKKYKFSQKLQILPKKHKSYKKTQNILKNANPPKIIQNLLKNISKKHKDFQKNRKSSQKTQNL